MIKVLAIGPASVPVTGQSHAFQFYVKNSKLDILSLTYSQGWLDRIRFICHLLYLSCFGNFDIVYFTSSRSKFGFFRDFFLILFCGVIRGAPILNHLHGSDFVDFRTKCSPMLRMLLDWTL